VVSRDLAVLVYICDRIGCDRVDVMHSGRLLEMTVAAALAEGHATDPYSQQLPRANQGVDASGGVIEVAA
jgi:ABC-type dipeptide/oligopeptide/nickel transport system ATPase subunit